MHLNHNNIIILFVVHDVQKSNQSQLLKLVPSIYYYILLLLVKIIINYAIAFHIRNLNTLLVNNALIIYYFTKCVNYYYYYYIKYNINSTKENNG